MHNGLAVGEAGAVAGAVGYHHACRALLHRFEQMQNRRSERWFRVFNESAVVLFAAIVVLVVVKPFLMPDRRPRSSATPLALAWAALVLYASLFPFSGWRWPPGQSLEGACSRCRGRAGSTASTTGRTSSSSCRSARCC